MEIATYKEKLDAEIKPYKRNYFSDPLNSFLQSDDMSMIFTFPNIQEARECVNAVKQYKIRHDLNVVIYKKRNKVYVIKG